MSHFALVINGIVVRGIVAEQEYIDTLDNPEEWIQTSFNTHGGIHYVADSNRVPSEDQTKALRKNFAQPGYSYDEVRDAFIEPQPYNSWTLDEETCYWNPPEQYPDDGKAYLWDEETLSWTLDE